MLDPGTLQSRWRQHAHEHPEREAIIHYVAGEAPLRWRWAPLMDRACELAARLAADGVAAGQTCALIMRHNPEFYPLYLAVVLLGAVPSVLAYPNPRLHPNKFRHGLSGMARRSGLDWLLAERSLEGTLAPLALGYGSSIRGLLFPLEFEPRGSTNPLATGTTPLDVAPTDACLLQHSSGTTGLQKAVVLSHRAVIDHAVRYGAAIQVAGQDRIVSWLPLYHDMGLIAAFHMPLILGIPTIQLDPFEWVLAPVLLLEAIAAERATLTWLPNFAYNFMTDRVHEEDIDGLRFDSLRMIINCSEPVRADSHARFYARFRDYGISKDALAACYAMAETTFCVTQTRPGIEARQAQIARDDLERGVFRSARPGELVRTCVSSGQPIEGCEVRVVDDAGIDLPAGRVGELVVRSPSLFDGYRNNEPATRTVLHGDWYWTGDLGVLDDGECYVVGRKKDLIIVAGKNMYPEDIEDTVSGVPGVQPGRVVAFGLEDVATGTERVCIVAEASDQEESPSPRIRQAIVAALMAMDVTVALEDVYLKAPRWLVKSSAGKPSRSANKDRLLSEIRMARSDRA